MQDIWSASHRVHATPKTAESGVRNEMFPAKALGWTSSNLWWFGWMVIWGESLSQTKIWDFCEKKQKHLQSSSCPVFFMPLWSSSKSNSNYIEAVSCHSINCNKWMSSKGQTRLLFFCIFKFTLHFSLVVVFCEIKNIRDAMWFCASDLVSVCNRKYIQFNYWIVIFIYYF